MRVEFGEKILSDLPNAIMRQEEIIKYRESKAKEGGNLRVGLNLNISIGVLNELKALAAQEVSAEQGQY